MSSGKFKAVFLDRDGTINEDVGYLNKVENFKLISGAKPAVGLLKEMGFKVFVVSNQSGIGRGIVSQEVLDAIHEKMREEFAHSDIEFDGVVYCPHRPEEKCACRKPSPKMIKDLAKKYDVDLKKSYIVGDKISDVLTGKNATCKTILLLSEEDEAANVDEEDEEWPSPDYVADHLSGAVEWILKDSGALEVIKAEIGIKRKD